MVLLLTDDQDEVLGGMVTLLPFCPAPPSPGGLPGFSPPAPSPPRLPGLAARTPGRFGFATPGPLRGS